jgi:hypothetical protein
MSSISPHRPEASGLRTRDVQTSSDRYENQILPSGFPSGSPEEALDCACRLYLDNPA